ncbi:MAG: 30S ribosomal protein S8e [Archaeoglobaceae archaeon]|nr:30S ribosomal protein S8e [Archaeoglobaceae archaeon]MDW7989382.1 30S ribosomal protein S8e [Archaeoglobaceae archaeon]
MIFQGRSRRKSTGGLYRPHRKKRKYELGGEQVMTTVGDRKVKKDRIRGGIYKIRLFADKYANVYDPEQKKVVRAEIKGVAENPANVHYVRHGVITKGAIITTSIGKAKVTNRPSQEGIINAILLKEKQ